MSADAAAADDRDRDVRRRQPLRAVRVEEQRVGGNQQQRERHAERERLRGQQADDAARRCGRSLVATGVCGSARRRATSAAITPNASSGQSARRSSSTSLSTRRTSVGSSAVTDAARGSGTSAASSPTVCARPQLDERLVTAVHANAALDDRVEVRLDRAFLDQDVARRNAHARGRPRRPRRARAPERRRTGRRGATRQRARRDRATRSPVADPREQSRRPRAPRRTDLTSAPR